MTHADGGQPSSTDAGTPSFVRDVWPVFKRASCTSCHNEPFRGDFRDPDSAYAALTDPQRAVGHICNQGETPILEVVVPGDPDRSGLWRLVGVGYHGCATVYGMPKNDARGILRDFDPAGADAIRTWISRGAPKD